MRIVDSTQIDAEQWDFLVDRTPDASMFSYFWYLNSVAENWCAVIGDNYKFGIALPYTVRLGQKILYTPIFVSYLELLGDSTGSDAQIAALIRGKFNVIEFCCLQDLLGEPSAYVVCQDVDSELLHIGSQLKRMLKKAEKHGFQVVESDDSSSVFEIIRSELQDKFTGITSKSLNRLENAFQLGEKSGKQTVLRLENASGELLGGIITIESSGRLVYVKGATRSYARENGGMFLLIKAAIERARQKKKRFDFGGSNVAGVAAFNANLGGTDARYYHYSIDNAPTWYKLSKKVVKSVKSK